MKTLLLAALFTMSTTISQLPVIPLASLDGTEEAWVQKNGVDYQLSLTNIKKFGGCDEYCASLVIPSAQVLTLNGTPLQIVAAPGGGKAIEVISVSGALTWNSAAYATNTNLQIYSATANDPQFEEDNLLESTASRILKFEAVDGGAGSPTATQIVENQALLVKVETGNPTAGDSDIEVYVKYRIITL